jgi:hypothetical protein
MLFYILGGLIGVIFFKKKYNLTFWQAIWNGFIFSFVLYFGWGLIIGIMSLLVGLEALPLWEIVLYFLLTVGGILKLGNLKKQKTLKSSQNEISQPKQYFSNLENNSDPKLGDFIETSVAGVTFEGRQELIKNLHIGESIKLIREFNNPYDINAIKVVSENNSHIGYINRKLAEKIAPIMENNIMTKELVGEVCSIYQVENEQSIIGVKIKFFIG